MRSLEEIHRSLAETEEELEKLAARRSELLVQVSELQKEKASHGAASSLSAETLE